MIPSGFANRIYDILRGVLEASEEDRYYFIKEQLKGCREYRFGGSLGFGGKFWDYDNRWFVSCYLEDETKKRNDLIWLANEKLTALKEEYEQVVIHLDRWELHSTEAFILMVQEILGRAQGNPVPVYERGVLKCYFLAPDSPLQTSLDAARAGTANY